MAAKKTLKKTVVKTAVVPPMTVSFNRQAFTYDARTISVLVNEAMARKVAPNAMGAVHKVTLPGVDWPTSLGWTITALTGILPQGFSKAGNLKGAYHPQQAMAFLSKLAPYGVRVETNSNNPRYAPFGENARNALEAMRRAALEAQQAREAALLKAQRDAQRNASKSKSNDKSKGKGKGK